MTIFLALFISYLFGSIPFAFILVKICKNTDLRSIGSGNIGATNALRVAGAKIGAIALLLDMAKGALPVIVLPYYVNSASQQLSLDTIRLFIGAASICGHNWTIFLRFKGGKGIATSFGVLIGLAATNIILAKVLGVLALIWLVTFLTCGYVSLASIISAFFLPIFLLIFSSSASFITFGFIIAIFALYRHKSNIYRLLHHQEHRFDIKSKLSFLRKKALP